MFRARSNAPEDGWDHCPKHVELIGIINKPLLLHLVGVYIIYINDPQSNKHQTFECGNDPSGSIKFREFLD
jgi:NADH:ubiquinone oxidoreductase subunit 3 (subunit A)